MVVSTNDIKKLLDAGNAKTITYYGHKTNMKFLCRY